jgi:hypothetical protein
MLMRLVFLILGTVLAFGSYVTYGHNATTMQRLGDAAHNLWHPDYPTEIP